MLASLSKFAVALALFSIFPVGAWDIEPGTTAPLIYANAPEIRITAATVELRDERVKLTYELKNSSDQIIQLQLSAYTTPYSWQGYASDYSSLHFPEYKIEHQGATVKKEVSSYAWHNGKNIFAELIAHKIDPFLVSQPDAAIFLSELKKKRALPLLQKGIFLQRDDIALPAWLIQQNVSWKIKVNPSQKSSLVVEYSARPSVREVVIPSVDFSSLIYRHCGAPEDIVNHLNLRKDTNPNAVIVSEYQIPLTIGNILLPAPTLTVQATEAKQTSALIATLSCGPEDAEILGAPNIPMTNIGHKTRVGVLRITVQRK